MAKSKQTTVFTLEDGRHVVFDQSRFQYEVNNWKKRIAAETKKYPGCKIDRIQNDRQGAFSPSNEDDLYSEATIGKNSR